MSIPRKWHVGRAQNQAFIDAIRAVLGLDPLFSGPKSEAERFYRAPLSWKSRADGMTPWRGSSGSFRSSGA